MTLDEVLSDSLVSLAKSTIENHALFKKIQNNLVIKRAPLYKSPDTIINVEAPDLSVQESLAKNSVIGGIIIGFIINPSSEPTESQFYLADINGDGSLDVLDVIALVNIIIEN